MSWLWRGFQSAVFYYVSCAPCFKLRSRRRQRLRNKRLNEPQTTSEAEEGFYPHTSPFSTNQYWREEILLGPGPPSKRKDRDKNAGKEKEKERTLGTGDGSLATESSNTDNTSNSVGGEASQVGEGTPQAREGDEGWNRKRYHREDEILWGYETSEGKEDSNNSATRVRSTTIGSSSSCHYYYARNPAINDLHPPTVSTQPTNKSQMQWMLQPPPSPKVMAGKEPASRSRSDSGGSKSNSLRKGNLTLGRLVGEKLMEEKMRKGGVENELTMSRMSSRDSKVSKASSGAVSRETVTEGQKHDRDRPTEAEQQDGDVQEPPMVMVADGVSHEHRPRLSTIPSTSLIDATKATKNVVSSDERRISFSPLADIVNRQDTTANAIMNPDSSNHPHNSYFPPLPTGEFTRDWRFPVPITHGDHGRK